MDHDSRYELLEKIGSGSFATVYRARDLELNREVAVKQIHEEYLSDPDQLDRYWQEAQLLASFQHPNIVTIYDIVRERGWLVMELMQTNLSQRLDGRQMDLKSLRTSLAHCLRALKYLHSRGIIHGDIKPSNMMIDARRRIKLGDFGLARRVSDEEGSLLKGTTKYMAPEVVTDEFGEVGPSSDLYSLGFTAYELMCGENFDSLFPGLSAFGRNMQVAWMMWHAAPDRKLPEIKRVLDGVPEDLAGVIETLTNKDQSKRFQSADEALSALNIDLKIINKGGDSGEFEDEQVALDGDKKKKMLAIGAFAASVLISLLVLFMPSGGTEEPPQVKPTYGIVKDVYLDEHSLKVENIEDGSAHERKLGPNPRIFLVDSLQSRRQSIVLREIQPGDRVEIERTTTDQGKPIVNVVVSRPVSNVGVVEKVDLQNDRIVVRITEGELRESVPLRVPERAEILLNGSKMLHGRSVDLRNVSEGDRAVVTHLDEAGGRGGRVLDRLDVARTEKGSGFVEKYDPGTMELVIRYGKGSTAGTTRLPIAKDCKISIPGGSGQPEVQLEPAELQGGEYVEFTYDSSFRTIRVHRANQTTEGVVQSVRTIGDGEVVVTTADNKQLTISIDPTETNVKLGFEAASYTDLRQYDHLVVLYDESSDGRFLAKTIDASRPAKNDRWAIIIGNEGFSDKFLSPLPYSLNNANLFEETLINRYGFKKERILQLHDATHEEIQRDVTKLLLDTRSQTQVVVYVTTRGYVNDEGSVFLATKDFNWDRMEETGLSLDWLAEQLDKSASKDKLLLLDASHAGSGKDLDSQPSTAAMLSRLKTPLAETYAIASCSDGERGREWEENQQGVFAHFVSEAFKGAADRDRDLHITANELISFLKTEMAVPGGSGKPQTPTLFKPQQL